jgi:hypothetical protein
MSLVKKFRNHISGGESFEGQQCKYETMSYYLVEYLLNIFTLLMNYAEKFWKFFFKMLGKFHCKDKLAKFNY